MAGDRQKNSSNWRVSLSADADGATRGGCPIISPTPEQCGDDSGGSDDGDGSGGGDPNSGGSDGSGSGSSGSSGSSNGESSGSGGSSSGGVAGDIANGLSGVLPSTGGGMALWALGAGLLLIAGGLLMRKVLR